MMKTEKKYSQKKNDEEKLAEEMFKKARLWAWQIELNMYWSKTVALLKLCNTPVTIFSPFPIFAISLFLISTRGLSIYDLPVMFYGIAVSLLLTFPSNLWNHCNDLKEDKAAGKKTILTQDISMQKTALFAAVLLYASSLLFSYYLSNEFKRPIYLYALIWVIATLPGAVVDPIL